MNSKKKVLNIFSWNMRSLTGAQLYINDIVSKHDSDIICLSEHRLFECELIKLGQINSAYKSHGKASNDLKCKDQYTKRGHCGVAILWKNTLAHRVKVMKIKSDRICGIEMLNVFNGKSLFIINVYLPQQGCKIASYEEVVCILSATITVCKLLGEVLVIGDTNAHFGVEFGDRFWGKTTPNAKLLSNCIKTHDMVIVDSMSAFCNGPKYTFAVDNVGSSYVDHFITSKTLSLFNVECNIIPDTILNTSDHLALICKIKLPEVINRDSAIEGQSHIAWHKLKTRDIEDCYTKPLDKSCELILVKIKLIEESMASMGTSEVKSLIEELIEDIKCAIQYSASNLPKSRCSKSLKPYWNKHLTLLSNQKKCTWKKWINVGRPNNGDKFKEYRLAKAEFRREQKQAIISYELLKMSELVKCQEMDQQYFWYLVNRNKKKANGVHPIKATCGEMIVDPDKICEEWKNYFVDLYTPKDKGYDDEFKAHVERSIKEMLIQSELNISDSVLEKELTVKEVENVIKGLKCRKAPGYDNIVTESFKYAGVKFKVCLTKLFNLICKIEYIPQQFKKGVIVPIPKGNKNKSIKDNYRGITLLPVISKIYEKCIIVRVENWARRCKIINEQQGAAQLKCSSIHVAWLVQETIAKYVEEEKNVYVSLLDTKKAYDSVWQDGLFYILYNAGLNGKTWRILRQFYIGFMCHVKIENKLSVGFEALQGIHQGAPCSMFMFEVFTSKLLENLSKCMYSLNVYGTSICSPAYADDLTVMALSKEGLQMILSLVNKYSTKWRFEFNSSKCKVMVFGNKKKSDLKCNVKLGQNLIDRSECEVLLGTILTDSKAEEILCYENRIEKCKTILYATQSLGSNVVPISPVTGSKLYWAVCVPKLCYGLEVMQVCNETMINIEKFHCGAAKNIQGLPSNCANYGAIVTAGWMSLSAHCDIIRLLFLWRLLLLPMNCLYKRMLLCRLVDIFYNPKKVFMGPTKAIVDICKKYDLYSVLRNAVLNGDYLSMSKWKKMVKQIVAKRDLKRIVCGCKLYKVLDYLNIDIAVTSISPWWQHAYRNPSFARKNITILRTLLNVERYGVNPCTKCNLMALDTVEHILFQCSAKSTERDEFWLKVLAACPQQLKAELLIMPFKTRSVFILNGFKCVFIEEWNKLYCALSMFIWNMFDRN